MDFIVVEKELRELANKQRELSGKYAKIRHDYGVARHNLFLLLVAKQKEKDYKKASLDKQIIMLLSETLECNKIEVYKYAEDYTKLEQDYKGLDKLIEAYASRISSIQSLLRYERENT